MDKEEGGGDGGEGRGLKDFLNGTNRPSTSRLFLKFSAGTFPFACI
jgi:hypothetical protein